MNQNVKIAAIVAACGSVAGMASAQPFGVYGGGATLQADFFQADESTFDFIDLDQDGWSVADNTTGVGGIFPADDLVITLPATPANEAALFQARLGDRSSLDAVPSDLSSLDGADASGNSFLHLYYRRVGSGNGIRELLFKGAVQEDGTIRPVDNLPDETDGDPFIDADPSDGVFSGIRVPTGAASDDLLNTSFASEADFNKQLFIDNGAAALGFGNEFNRGLVPYRQFDDANGFPLVARETSEADFAGSFSETLAFVFGTDADIPGTISDPAPANLDGANRGDGSVDNGDAVFLTADLPIASTTGVRSSFSASDVPLTWFLQVPESPVAINGVSGPRTAPTTGGYGINPTDAVNPDGTTPTVLPDGVVSPRTNSLIAAPTAVLDRVFDTALVSTPVAAVVNYGVGMEEILMSDLRTLSATGRRVNGENLMKVTRDSGSGTRNAFMNGIRLDPAWGRGENVGFRNGNDNVFGALGPEFLPSNKSGSSRLEATVRAHRLAIGHSGAERDSLGFQVNSEGDLVDTNRLDVLAVRSDIKEDPMTETIGQGYFRPTLEAVLNGGVEGYNINGPAAIATIGDPRQAAPELGGIGWRPDITGENAGDNPLDNPPFNPAAAGFLNNITRSLDAFTGLATDTALTPGEFLALSFVPPQAQEFIPDPSPEASDAGLATVANPDFNATLQAFILSLPTPTVPVTPDLARIGEFRADNGGPIPVRQQDSIRPGTEGDDILYSESTDPTPLSNAFGVGGSGQGVAANNFYVTQGNLQVTYGTSMDSGANNRLSRDLMRNKIAGDFDGDEARTPADVQDMLEALIDREGGADWVAPAGTGPTNGGDGDNGSFAIIEVLGDFDGDGSFTRADIRYWADGLHVTETAGVDWVADEDRGMANGGIDPTANRGEGFAAIDAEWQNLTGNLFWGSTVLATGAAYEAGDAAADVGGNLTPPGYRPIGWDGNVNAEDIDYVFANFGDFTDIDQAVTMDLSADMNGDLQVDGEDIAFVIETVLETELGDFNLDGVRNDDDRQIIVDNLGETAGYAQGDINGDGVVNNDDLEAFGGGGCNVADIAEPFGVLNSADVTSFVNAFQAGDAAADIAEPTGVLNSADVTTFVNAFQAGCP